MLLIAAVFAVIVVLWIIHAVVFYFMIALFVVAGFGLFRLGRWSSSRRART
jgi:hypothetical protein